MTNKCVVCGNSIKHKREDARTCSSACRTKLSRMPEKFDSWLTDICRKISEMGDYVYTDELSLDVAIALNTIITQADYHRQNNASSWWRCSECGVAVRRSFPDKNSCGCSEPVWVLQKTMI